MRWIVDGNNVFGSRPDGWWNDRAQAQRRFAQRVAEWCRDLAEDVDVTLVFDAPVAEATAELAGGNLRIVEASRRGRDAADDTIVELVDAQLGGADHDLVVVTSDRGLRARLPSQVRVIGAGRFRESIAY
jgi:predicted RNA-binding protein with PIN domain